MIIDPNQRIDAKAQLLTDEGETLLMQNDFTGLNSLLHQLADEIQRVLVEGWTDHRAPIFRARTRGRGVLDPQQSGTKEPMRKRGLTVLAKSGLTLAQEYVWGEERVEHYLRTPVKRENFVPAVRRPLAKQTLVEGALVHVDIACDTPPMIVASLACVHHNQELIQRNKRPGRCWSRD